MSEPSRERNCGKVHPTIPEAIRCVESSLGVAREDRLRPYWGSTKFNDHLIVGWQIDGRRRWRLDYDDHKGPHINEENYSLPPHLQKTVHPIERPPVSSGEMLVLLQQRKWTAAGDVEK